MVRGGHCNSILPLVYINYHLTVSWIPGYRLLWWTVSYKIRILLIERKCLLLLLLLLLSLNKYIS